MLPLHDRLPRRTVPWVTWSLLAINVVVFLWQSALVEVGYTGFVADYGFVPYRFLHAPAGEAFTIFTSMFMHGGWLHVLGNMLFLWIFGDNVEDAIGHFRYLAFYLLGGVAAAFAQLAMDPASTVPMIGASGAIAAVLGAYLSLYPRSPVAVLNPIPLLWFVFGLTFELPAWFVALEFFFANLFSGMGALHSGAPGGVAFFAHVGGFLAGLLLIRPFMIGRSRLRADVWSGWRSPPRRFRPRDDDRFGPRGGSFDDDPYRRDGSWRGRA